MSLAQDLEIEGLQANAAALRPVTAAADHDVKLLPAAAAALEAMLMAAAHDDVALASCSGFRSVDRQTQIWERKFREAVSMFGDRQTSMCKVLEYSAPPGWSRHHWGTDVDLVAGTLIQDARLESEDWEEGGPCAEADAWLEVHAADYGFLRPYDEHRGGFLAEPWHWSFAPAALPLQQKIRRLDWRMIFRGSGFEGSDLLASQVNRLFHDFVLEINPALR